MNDQDKVQRTVLPIPDRPRIGLVTYDAKDPDTQFPPIKQLRPPKGAPDVLIILLDDVGFGASSAFGGPCNTPTAERLASGGLKYNRFHTTALLLADATGHADRTQPPHRWHGRGHGNQLAIAGDAVNLDHLVSPEDAVRIAMAQQ